MSDSEDISMSDPEPEATDSPTIFIPDPPTLPALYKDDQGVVHNTEWIKHAQHFVAKFNKSGTGFDVRQENGANPLADGGNNDDDDGDDNVEEEQEEKDDDVEEEEDDADEWPYHLGPSTKFSGQKKLIGIWGIQLLDAAGFINYETDTDAYMDFVGRGAKVRNPLDLETERIHPIFRKDMFHNINDHGYKLILPAILLASACLDDPTTLNFFYGVWATEQHTSFWKPDLGNSTIVHVPDSLSEEQQRQTHEKILAMRNWVSWHFIHPSQLAEIGAGALTRPVRDDKQDFVPASAPDTHQSRIFLSTLAIHILDLHDRNVSTHAPQYERLLEDTLDLAGIPNSHKFEQFNLNSAIMRTHLMLAMYMIHEFAHAFRGAYYNAPHSPWKHYKEPWISGDVNNEMGYALVRHVLGETPWALTIWRPPMSHYECALQSTACPYGLCTLKKWDAGRGMRKDTREHFLPDVPEADPQDPQVAYPLPQKHIHNLYTKEMWTQHVPRYGLAALKLPQPAAWSVTNTPR